MTPQPARVEGVYFWHSRAHAIGEGWYLVVAFDRRRKYLSLLAFGTLATATVLIEDWERDRRRGWARADLALSSRFARRLDGHRRHLKALGLPIADETARRVVAGLEALEARAA